LIAASGFARQRDRFVPLAYKMRMPRRPVTSVAIGT
jgi:hypothetical protein